MAVLDLVACPICRAQDSLVRQTTQLESRTHVTYECQQCGTLLVWLGDEMWLEADRWSFQKVGLPDRADLLYRSMTVAELRKLAGQQAPYTAPAKKPTQAIPPPVWIDMAPAAEEPLEEDLFEEDLLGDFEEEPEAEPEPLPVKGVEKAAVGAAVLAQTVETRSGTPAAAKPDAPPAAARQEEVEEAPQIVTLEPPTEASAAATVAGAAVEGQEEAASVAPPQAAEQKDAAGSAAEPALAGETAAQPSGKAGDAASPATRSSPPRRRSRGSPFLVISVALVLLCLICSAATMVIYSMWQRLPAGAQPTGNPPASVAQPTDTLVPTGLPSPTAMASPMPTETPPEAAGTVEFQGVTGYLSSTGTHYLVGEVLNRTADTLRFVEVLATFYDAGGQLIGTGSTFTELSMVEPGSTAPFKMATLDPPDGWRYELRVDYSTTTQSPVRLELMGHSASTSDSGWYHVTGDVRNPHAFAIKFPEIVVTYYNAAHEIVRVEVDFAQVDPLEPGQSSPFEVVLTDPPADLMHYALQTEGVQQ